MSKSPFSLRQDYARDHLEKALKLAEASTRRLETSLVPKIKEVLSVLSELASHTVGFPFAGSGNFPFGQGMPGSIEDLLDFFVDTDDSDEEEDDAGFGPFFGSNFPARRQPSRRSRQKPKTNSKRGR
jgi:hypothetical protein